MKRLSRGTTWMMVLALAACGSRPAGTVAGAGQGVADWSGIWSLEGIEPGISGFPAPPKDGNTLAQYPLLGLTAPWNPAGRARFEANLRMQGDRKAQGWGFPMMMGGAAPLQFLITPGETLILNMYREVRHVYTDGRDHPSAEDRWATTWGDSVGRWEGDTLVIDTIAVADPLKFFFAAPPLSEDAHYVERLRKVSADRIESEVTIEDPQTLTAPWKAKIVYTRMPNMDRMIHDDFVNDRSEAQDGAFTIEPPKD